MYQEIMQKPQRAQNITGPWESWNFFVWNRNKELELAPKSKFFLVTSATCFNTMQKSYFSAVSAVRMTRIPQPEILYS